MTLHLDLASIIFRALSRYFFISMSITKSHLDMHGSKVFESSVIVTVGMFGLPNVSLGRHCEDNVELVIISGLLFGVT